MGQRTTLKLKRILICGDRKWNDALMIYRAMQEELELHGPLIVIEGEAPGADRMSRIAADSLRFPVRRFPADWKRYGRAAGPIRNKQMLEEGMPDEVWSFHDNIAKSKGTANMVKIATEAGIPVRFFSHAK